MFAGKKRHIRLFPYIIRSALGKRTVVKSSAYLYTPISAFSKNSFNSVTNLSYAKDKSVLNVVAEIYNVKFILTHSSDISVIRKHIAHTGGNIYHNAVCSQRRIGRGYRLDIINCYVKQSRLVSVFFKTKSLQLAFDAVLIIKSGKLIGIAVLLASLDVGPVGPADFDHFAHDIRRIIIVVIQRLAYYRV